MILTKNVKIHIKGKFIARYKDLGYDVNTKGLNVIKVEDLPLNSNVKVMVKCDNCNIEKELRIQDYYTSVKNDKYSCKHCSSITYKNTMLFKYGVENSFQLKETITKSNNTKTELYGNKNFNNRKKSTETCLDKYNVENPQQNKEIKDKTKITNLKTYGFDVASKNKKVQEKTKETNLIKWGSLCTLHSDKQKEKIKKIFIDKYGFDNPMKNKEIFTKAQITGLKRKKYLNTELLYQGTYELDFLNKYYDKLLIENGKSIKIKYKEKNTMYHSDFFIPNMNLIVEIKSSYWYEKYYEKNIIKQITCEKLGYKYIIIIDKKYNDFDLLL